MQFHSVRYSLFHRSMCVSPRFYMNSISSLLLFFIPLVAIAGNNNCSRLMERAITQDWLDQQRARVDDQAAAQTRLGVAVRKVGLDKVAVREEILKNHSPDYTFKLKGQGETDQHQTGRCWVFGAQSVMRAYLLASGLLPHDFEISETDVWENALLERANIYIEDLFKSLYRRVKPAEMQEIAIPSISEGGTFHEFLETVKKYGVVPKSQMPETSGTLRSGVTQELNLMLSTFGLKWVEAKNKIDQARRANGGAIYSTEYKAIENSLREEKAKVMAGVYQILVTHLGQRPKTFKLRISDRVHDPLPENAKAGTKTKPHESPISISREAVEMEMTPMQLLDLTGFLSEEWIIVSYLPQKEFGRRYRFPNSRGVVPEGDQDPRNLEYFNLPIERLLQLVVKTLHAGYPVEFGSDVKKSADFEHGILHPDLYDTDAVYGDVVNRKELLKSKSQLNYLYQSFSTHAMAIVGEDSPDPSKPPIKYLVQNSWGSVPYLHMYQEWAELFLYNAAIPRRLFNEEEQKQLDAQPITLKFSEMFRK